MAKKKFIKSLGIGPVRIGLEGAAVTLARNKNWDVSKLMLPLRKKSWAELHAFFETFRRSVTGKDTVTSQINAYKSWIHIACSVIYRRVGEIEFKFYRMDTDEEIKKTDDIYRAISQIFIDPNPYMEYTFLKQYWQLQLDLTGMAFGFVELDPVFKLPIRVWPLNVAEFVRIEKGATFRDWIAGYTFNHDGQYKTYKPEQILYFHYPHPEDPRSPCSPVQKQAYAVDIDHYLEVYERAFFENSARPDFAVSYPEDVSIEEEDAERLKEKWKKKFSTSEGGRFHELAVLDKGAKLFELNPKNKDLMMIELAGWTMNKILAAYNVPAGKVGIVKDVNKANAEGIDVTFNSESIKPRLKLHDTVVTRGILQKYDHRLYVKHDDPVPRDRQLDIEEIKEKVGVPIWTINEGRRKDNLSPIAGGDVVMVPLNFIPHGQQPIAEEETITDYIEAEIIEKDETKQLPAPKEVKEETTDADFDYTEEWKVKRWNVFKAYTEAWEGVWRTQLSVLFQAQMDEVLGNLEKAVATDKIGISFFTKGKEITEAFERRYETHLKRYHYEGSQWTSRRIAGDIELNHEVFEKMIAVKDPGLVKIGIQGLIKNIPFDKTMIKLKRYIEDRKKGVMDQSLFNWKKNLKLFDETGKKITGTIVVESANEALTSLGMEPTISIANQKARKYVGDEVAEFSRDVLSTKANQLKRTLSTGIKKGENIRQLTNRVEGIYDGVIKGRADARRIARTEVTSATNRGTHIGYEESGVVEEKGWLSIRDTVTRGNKITDDSDHVRMDGQRVLLDQPFIDPRSGARLLHPGDTSLGARGIDVIYCRCTMIPYTQKSSQHSGEASQVDIKKYKRSTGLNAVGNARVRRGINPCKGKRGVSGIECMTLATNNFERQQMGFDGESIGEKVLKGLGYKGVKLTRHKHPFDVVTSNTAWEIKTVGSAAKEHKMNIKADQKKVKLDWAKKNKKRPKSMLVIINDEARIYIKDGLGKFRPGGMKEVKTSSDWRKEYGHGRTHRLVEPKERTPKPARWIESATVKDADAQFQQLLDAGVGFEGYSAEDLATFGLRAANNIGKDYDRVLNEFAIDPVIPKGGLNRVIIQNRAVATFRGKKVGSAYYFRGDQHIGIATLDHVRKPTLTKGGFTSTRDLAGGFRHELGHDIFWRHQVARDEWYDVFDAYMDKWGKYELEKEISFYASTNGSEAFAEAFTFYTSPVYGIEDSLPKVFEDFFVKHFPRRK